MFIQEGQIMILVRAFTLDKIMSKPSHLYLDLRNLQFILWILIIRIYNVKNIM